MEMKKTMILAIALGLCLATCASSQKKLQQAKEKDPQYQYSMGAVYLNNNNLDEAEEEFKKVTADAKYGSKELPYYNLARLYSLRQDWETALFYADKAIQTNARYHLGHSLRGYILESQGKFGDALESYKQAVKL